MYLTKESEERIQMRAVSTSVVWCWYIAGDATKIRLRRIDKNRSLVFPTSPAEDSMCCPQSATKVGFGASEL